MSSPMKPSENMVLFDNIKKIHAALKKNLECTICMEIPKQLSRTWCGHFFCQKCINQLIKDRKSARCPICNASINRRNVVFNDDMSKCAEQLRQLSNALEHDFDEAILAEYNDEDKTHENITFEQPIDSYEDKLISSQEILKSEDKVSQWLNDDSKNKYKGKNNVKEKKSSINNPSKSRDLLELSNQNNVQLINKHENYIVPSTSKICKDESDILNQSIVQQTLQKQWGLVKEFGKEMRPKRKTRSLNVIVESTNKLPTSASKIQNNFTNIDSEFNNKSKLKIAQTETKLQPDISQYPNDIIEETIMKNDNSNNKKKSKNKPQIIEEIIFKNCHDTISLETNKPYEENLMLNNPDSDVPINKEIKKQKITEKKEPVTKQKNSGKENVNDKIYNSYFLNQEKRNLISPKNCWLSNAEKTEISLNIESNCDVPKENDSIIPLNVISSQNQCSLISSEIPNVEIKSNVLLQRPKIIGNRSLNIKRLVQNLPKKHDLVNKSQNIVRFQKLGKMIRKRKTIPFYYFGSLRNSINQKNVDNNEIRYFSFNSETTITDSTQNISNKNVLYTTSESIPVSYAQLENNESNNELLKNDSDSEYIPNTQPMSEQLNPNNKRSHGISNLDQESSIQVQFLSQTLTESPNLLEKKENDDYGISDNKLVSSLIQNSKNEVSDSDSEKKLSMTKIRKITNKNSSTDSSNSFKLRFKRRRVLPLKDTPPDDLDEVITIENENYRKDNNSDESSRKSNDTEIITFTTNSIRRNPLRKLSSSSSDTDSFVSSKSNQSDLQTGKRKRPSSDVSQIDVAKATLNNWCKDLNLSTKKSIKRNSGSKSSTETIVITDVQHDDNVEKMDITDNMGYNILSDTKHPEIPDLIIDKVEKSKSLDFDTKTLECTSDNFDKIMGEIDTQVLLGKISAIPSQNNSKCLDVEDIETNTLINEFQNKMQNTESPETMTDCLDDNVDDVQNYLQDGITNSTVIYVPKKHSLIDDTNNKKLQNSQYLISASYDVSKVLNESVNSNKKQSLKNSISEDVQSNKSRKSAEANENKNESIEHCNVSNEEILDDTEDSFDITQNVLLIKQIEQDLLGSSKKTVKNDQSENCQILEKDEKYMNVEDKVEQNYKQKSSSPCTPSSKTENSYNYKNNILEVTCDEEEDIVENTPQVKKKRYGMQPRISTSLMQNLLPVDISPIAKLSPVSKALSTPIVANASSSKMENTRKLDNGLNEKAQKSKIYHSTPKIPDNLFNNQKNGKNKIINQINLNIEEIPEDITLAEIAKQKRLCFICSGLQSARIDAVKRFANLIGATYTNVFSPEVTHVIVKCEENRGADNTLKYLQGIAYQKWIVGFDWVVDCLCENKLLNEEKYEVVDGTSMEPGPRKSRLRTNNIFQDFAFLCLEPFTVISVEDCKKLIIQTGGTIVLSLDDLASMKLKYRIILLLEDTHNDSTIEKLYTKAQAIPVSQDWVTESISQYRLIPLPCYIQVASIADAIKLNFPKTLLEDDEEEVPSSYEDHA